MMDRLRARTGRSLLLAALASAPACGGPAPAADAEAALACADTGPHPTWDDDVQGIFRTYCNACHAADAPDRHGAPADVTFDTPQQALSWASRVRQRTLVDQTMPIGGGVPAEDRHLLAVWLDCPG